MDWVREVPASHDWILWINFVRDEYATIHQISAREATSIIYGLPESKTKMLLGLFNSATSSYEAAKQIGAPA